MQDRIKIDEQEKRPRGRPRAYEPEAALRQAADAFWRAGYAGTSLDDLSAATGMNRPSLKAAFGDKHAIYVKALVDYWERKFALIGEALAPGRPLAETLLQAYDAALDIYFSGEGQPRGCFVVGTAVTEALEDPVVREIVSEGFLGLDSRFRTRLEQAQTAGELAADADPETLALLASATMHTIAIRARAGRPREELHALARKAVNAISR
ncbi:TetR/AcrR family transcriptional regulator [Luteibacter aegosomaticola]|uniref:TetR/AcrR family transcriptional regulator n=1 Tax=Luteibacter aegosomaticola TaxID=2911538 RepID=UPI001FFAEBA7|nr:TetR/AcrR family transcriptional regulator [Luteibacter aegosomaticola]UPG90246.1 TetR/AcrR family transcriptional regulator [Luteibacter aegosomaticola]